MLRNRSIIALPALALHAGARVDTLAPRKAWPDEEHQGRTATPAELGPG